MADETPPSSSDKGELAHVHAQLTTVLAAMVLVFLVVWLCLDKLKPNAATAEIKASDVVAVVGAVTTFLGTAIGLFFGVSVGQAGKRSADVAAQAAQKSAKEATALTQQAQAITGQSIALASQAHAAGQEAVDRAQDIQAQLQSLKASSERLATRARQLHELAHPAHGTRASAIYRAAMTGQRPSDEKIQDIVSDIARTWLIHNGSVQAGQIVDTSLKLEAAPPDGFGLSAGSFLTMCDDCTAQINSECESAMQLSDDWRADHEDKTLDRFIQDAADLAISNPAA